MITSVFITNGPNKFYREDLSFQELMEDVLNYFCDSLYLFDLIRDEVETLEDLISLLSRFKYTVTVTE